MITLTINGREVQAPRGSTILEACRLNGIELPTLCYDPQLKLAGSCRMCIVEAEGRPLFLAACVAPADNGMVIETESPDIVEARKVILELLMARHGGMCLTCEKSGDCRLQDYCYQYGVSTTRFTDGGRPRYPIEDPNPFIERDYNKCIMCTRCVRACEGITMARAINVKNRGHQAKISTAFDGDLVDSPCVFCGQCIMVCPVGALTSKVSAGKGRSYEVDKVLTTCTYCGTGCTLELNVKDNQVVGVTSNRSAEWSPVNKGALCVKGRFGWEFINSPERLTQPLIRKNGELQEASWDEALDFIASRLGQIKEEHGPDSMAVFTSARITNEENYLAQKFTRAVLGTNNVDHCARL
ncbi:MAG: molybdopterin-dependent oxidoreductase [Syntrophomonadaceae bacterium]|nr:molybdopterin-dependent oxidoreductase [Syntrophomonadaceae bacterium]